MSEATNAYELGSKGAQEIQSLLLLLARCQKQRQELLEACKDMSWALQELRDGRPYGGAGLIAPYGDALDKGLAAIAKTEKEQP